MKHLTQDTLHDRARNLEGAYCARRDQELLQALGQRISEEEARRLLVAATGVQDEIELPALAELSAPHFLAVLGIFPMVDVAWSDGSLSRSARQAVLNQTHEMGVRPGSPAHDLLDRWLVTRPAAEAAGLWENYVRAVTPGLQSVTVEILKERVLRRARRVATADAGPFQFGRMIMISPAKEACLNRLESAFHRGG